MNTMGEKIGAGIAAIIGLAVLALVVSNAANTVNVLTSFFQGLSNLIGVAISPVTGQSVSRLSAGGLSGGTWENGISPYGTTGSGGNLGIATSGFSLSIPSSLITGAVNAAGSGLTNLFGSSSSGAVDSGTWDQATDLASDANDTF